MCVWNSFRVWISYRIICRKWNFISGDNIFCKHYPKWSSYTCPSKYRVVLKCSRNEISCKQNLFSRRLEISNWYQFISPLMWTYSYTETLHGTTHLRLKSWVWKCVHLVCVLTIIKYFINFRNVSFTEPNIQENKDKEFINWFVVSSIGTTLIK